MGRRAAARAVALAAWLLVVPASASAQQGLIDNLTAILDANLSSISTTVTDASGAITTSGTSFLPRLTLNTNALIYPNLRLNAGGVFEVSTWMSPADGGGRSTITRLRPFVELRSTNPILSPGVSYFRRENRTSGANVSALTLVSEDYAAYLGWKPVGLPLTDFQFVRTNTFDGKREFQDSTKDFGQVVSRYSYRGLNAYYQGAFLETTDRAHRTETDQVSNSGRLDHSQTFFAKRLQWNATYNVNRQDLTTVSSGEGGEVALPVIPFAGLALLSDAPVTAKLIQNPALVDGNLTAGAGVNLGLPAPGADAQARNIGLDFLSPTEINRFLVWIDRDLPAEISRSFSWEIYSSPDNLIWTREAAVSVAPFGPFENRFQLDFPRITARYIKAVTRPLSGAVLDSSKYPDIFVTELQAFLTSTAGEARGTLRRTTQSLNADVRMRILDTPSVYYEGSYWYNGVEQSGLEDETSSRDTLSNGVSFYHKFGRMFTAYGRGALEQGKQPEGHREATVTNATLTVDPVPALSTSFLYTGQDERIDDRPNDRRSFSVQTIAQLYRGVDVQVGFGWNFTTRETGEELRDRLVNVTATIVPRPSVTLTLNYLGTTTDRSGTFVGEPQLFSRRGFVTLAVDPIRTLRVVLEEEVQAVSDEKTRTTTNIGVNWSPFPDGALQFVVAWDDALRPLEFGTERNLRSGVRWTFSRQSYLDVSYQRLKSEYVLQTTESKIFGVDLRLFF